MLSFTRGSNSELSNFALQDSVNKSAESLMPRLHGSGVGLQVGVPPDSVPLIIYGSESGIEQVICNLVGNSID